MKEISESENNNSYDSNRYKQTIYDKITLSKKSRKIVILRAMIISLCCFFFPLEAVVNNRLQEIEMNLYVEDKLLSFIFPKKLETSDSFQSLLDIIMKIIGSKESIMVLIALIYLTIHPFIGLKLILVSSITQYFVIMLQILFQSHRPFWDLEQTETICRNTYPNPSSILFYCSFFYLYAIISFNLLKKKKFLPIQKILITIGYIIILFIYFIMFGGTYLLYIHQITYTFIISIVSISFLIDLDTTIHNFIFQSLKNVYNTRVYKMKIFFCSGGLYFLGFISLYFIDENDINKIKDKISQNPSCTDDDLEMFGIKQGLLNISFLSGLVGAFWGASYTVEKKVGKWWSKRSVKKTIIKILSILLVCTIFILIKYYMKAIKSKFELYFSLEAIFDFLECYCLFGPMTLFLQKIGFNDEYITKNYEKINVNLRDEDDVQFFRTTIFENEKKGKKKDTYVVIDKVDSKNEKANLKKQKENKDNKENEPKNEKEEKKIELNEINENDENEENEIYAPTSMIIKNVREHEEEEADFELYVENENRNKDDLIEPHEELNDDGL